MEKETLEQRYNTFYEEYRVYNDYAVKIAEQVKKDREDFSKFATENQNNPQELVNKLFEINEKQILHLTDLASLKGRLKIATELLVDVIDIPEEVLKEVNQFPNLEFLYKPSNGEMVAVNEEKIETVKKQWQEMYKEQIKRATNNV
jgi:predicted S18 family serine protease